METLMLSTESCAICESCAYPGAPCRHPDRMFPCVESFGILATALAERCGLTGRVPLWRENTCWAGLLIAVSNEFAPGNGHTAAQQRRRLQELAQEPAFARAMAALVPSGMGRNKQVVADLLRKRHYFLLTALYRLKNRNK